MPTLAIANADAKPELGLDLFNAKVEQEKKDAAFLGSAAGT